MNLIDPNYHWKNWVDWKIQEEKKFWSFSKIYILRKRTLKLKKHVFIIYDYNFAFKIETGRVTRTSKSILETVNINDVCIHGLVFLT